MPRYVASVAAALTLWFVVAPAAQQQHHVFLSISGPSGPPSPAVQPGEVTVLEDDMACRTVTAELINWPMKLTVMVDNGTRTSEYLSELRTGLQGFFNAIPDGVEVSLMTLAPQARWVVKPTTNRQQAIDGINLITPDNRDGQFFPALVEAGDRIEHDKNSFPVIVFFTTDLGGGRATEQQFEKLQKQMTGHAATVHAIVLSSTEQSRQPTRVNGAPASPARPIPQNGPRTPAFPTRGNSQFGEPQQLGFVPGGLQTEVGLALAKQTGGRYEGISAATRLATLFPELGQQIAQSANRERSDFLITYEPPPGAKGRPKRISSRFAREGYTLAISVDGHLP